MKTLLAAAVLLFAVGTEANDGERVKRCFEYTIEYEASISPCILEAKQGSASAQVRLGDMYFAGRGVPMVFTEAVKWYRMAAEQGDGNGLSKLGDMYYWGWGVKVNYKEAKRLKLLSVENGNIGNLYDVSKMYADGIGTRQDYKEAYILSLIPSKLYDVTDWNIDGDYNFEQYLTDIEIEEAKEEAVKRAKVLRKKYAKRDAYWEVKLYEGDGLCDNDKRTFWQYYCDFLKNDRDGLFKHFEEKFLKDKYPESRLYE